MVIPLVIEQLVGGRFEQVLVELDCPIHVAGPDIDAWFIFIEQAVFK